MDDSLTDVCVRQFEERDFYDVERIILEGFKDKFRVLAYLGEMRMLELFKDSGFISQKPYKGYLVAEYEKQVLGVLFLTWKGQKRPINSTLNVFQLVKKYGFKTMLKYYICLALLEDNITSKTCHAELLAVDEETRGLGVGTALLDAGLDFMEKSKNLKTFSLYVAESNTAAYRLYNRMGIKARSKKHSILTKYFFREESWIYMDTDIENSQQAYYVKRKGWWLGFIGSLGFLNISFSWILFPMFLWFVPERR
ncbi:MAG: N-acetyltransferase [Sphaerochaetaceae bacterium]|jgi:ribosomal protein S18 acetylase RimI-like enzyme|nr:N-acetyltransferase [Sphaerochaetaceae bacterium]MDD3365708.1 N-acetyltransferase [Sphaerochaetaceae bacterium]MDD4219523.1 N-acetyltransferase [Sphaerochaetaceae bacterium]MDY0370780.1 N-acetyltransferase [Sphaerochaetaceae bacterium]